MRHLEILLVLLSLLSILYLILSKKRPVPVNAVLITCLLIVTFLHLLLDGRRWQILAAYIQLPIILGALLFSILIKKDRNLLNEKITSTGIIKILAAGSGILLLLFTIYLAVEFPVFNLPKPAGPYQVGVSSFYFIDNGRAEYFTEDQDDFREIPVQIWYPANVSLSDKKMPYFSSSAAKGLLLNVELPKFFADYLKYIQTNSFFNAKLAQTDQKYPLIIFQHAYGGWPGVYSSYIENLASQGYVVVGITHQYESALFMLPDGEFSYLPATQESLAHLAEATSSRQIELIKANITKSDSEEDFVYWYKSLADNSPKMQQSVKTWSEDTSFVLDQIFQLNQKGKFFNETLDLAHIGVFGHSFGGAAAGQVILDDPRVTVGVNIDGFQYGDLAYSYLSKPFMFIFAEHASEGFPNRDELIKSNSFYLNSRDDAYILLIKGAEHSNFCDMALWGKQWSDVKYAQINSQRALDITNQYLLAFFDNYLKAETNGLQKIKSDVDPEVVFLSKND